MELHGKRKSFPGRIKEKDEKKEKVDSELGKYGSRTKLSNWLTPRTTREHDRKCLQELHTFNSTTSL